MNANDEKRSRRGSCERGISCSNFVRLNASIHSRIRLNRTHHICERVKTAYASATTCTTEVVTLAAGALGAVLLWR